MKKIISTILTVTILLSAAGIQSFALEISENGEEFDLSQYTIEDISDMSADEFRQLLADFERVYDPFDTYETDPIMGNINEDGTVSPEWTSGKKDGSETGSHEIITARACEVLFLDKGFFGDTQSEQFLISMTITLASLLPDRDATQILQAYRGHFYDPNTEENWAGSTTNTAKTNCMDHFKAAISAYKANNTSETYEELGWALHFMQDACQPQHASNFTELDTPLGAHGDFEDYTDARIETYTNRISSVTTYNFFGKGNYSYYTYTPNYYVKQAATIAYSYKNYTNTSTTTYWDYAANICVQNSVAFSAILMYSFAEFAGINLK